MKLKDAIYILWKRKVDKINPKLDLSKITTTGHVDKAIYDALVALGWDTDCIE